MVCKSLTSYPRCFRILIYRRIDICNVHRAFRLIIICLSFKSSSYFLWRLRLLEHATSLIHDFTRFMSQFSCWLFVGLLRLPHLCLTPIIPHWGVYYENEKFTYLYQSVVLHRRLISGWKFLPSLMLLLAYPCTDDKYPYFSIHHNDFYSPSKQCCIRTSSLGWKYIF